MLKKEAKKAHHKPADVLIGKKGLTDNVIAEIANRLKSKGVVKIKVLKKGLETVGLDRRTFAKKVSKLLGAKLAGIRGRTFVIYYNKNVTTSYTRSKRNSLRAKNLNSARGPRRR